jgi:hypothetical protein
MNKRVLLLLAILGTSALYAGTIRSLDVSSENTVAVRSGETLRFHLFTWNFADQAARYDLSPAPSDLTFALVTAKLGSGGTFAATLESEDRSISAAIGDLTFQPGTFMSSDYSGEISTLQGYLYLSPLLSESLFQSGSMVISLLNLGSDVELGLATNVLQQDMFASLSAGQLSVGALPGRVELEKPQTQQRGSSFSVGSLAAAPPQVPEPGSKGLLVAGGVLLCALSALLRRISPARTKP